MSRLQKLAAQDWNARLQEAIQPEQRHDVEQVSLWGNTAVEVR